MSRLIAFIAALLPLTAAAFNHDTVVSPSGLAPRFEVACSDIGQDATLIAPGASASDYWEGRPVNGIDHYITELLPAGSAAIRFDVQVPDKRSLYPGHAGDKVTFVAIVCYPTPRTNVDPSYTLPSTGDVIPHMQPRGQAPKFVANPEYVLGYSAATFDPLPTGPVKLPLIVYSHGLTGSPISKGYVQVLVQLASQGYIVAGAFHGDPRFSRVRIEDVSDLVYVVRDFDHIVELQLMRPLSLKAMTDVLLADPSWAAGIDTERIAGFGASMGGEAMAMLLGARLTTSLALDCSDGTVDPRIKVAVGYVPYMGQPFLPAFCDGQSGAKSVDRPYLAISGTADTTAPITQAQQAVNQFAGSHYLVQLIDGQHEFRPEDAGDLFTWMTTFLDAYLPLPIDDTAMGRFIKMSGVTGGRTDSMVVDVHKPFANAGTEATALEFFNTNLGHYFVSSGPGEIQSVESGGAGPGWQLTGQAFKTWLSLPTNTALTRLAPVCRFYGPKPNSHFYTAESGECDLVKQDPGWIYEGTAFFAQRFGSGCPFGMLEVDRAYNNDFVHNNSNHRFSTSDSTMRDMARQGWTIEGAVMCSMP